MRRVADEDATEKVGWLAVLGHAATGAMGDGDDSIDVREGAEDLWSEMGRDATGYGSGTVDRCEDTNVIAGGNAAVGTDESLESGGGFEECNGVSVGTDCIVALEVVGDEVVGVDEFAGRDGLGCEADDLVEFTHWFAVSDGADGEFVAGGNVGERDQAGPVERLPRSDGLECDDDVVGVSEFECLVAQTILFFLVSQRWSEPETNSGTTTLYSNSMTKG